MPDRQAIDRGIAWEARVADLIGGDQRPGSGNRWDARGDVARVFLFSCKAEKGRSWSGTRRQLREAMDDAVGTGLLPGLALLDEDGEELVVLRMSDLLEALAGESRFEVGESSGERRRRQADVPALLRDLND